MKVYEYVAVVVDGVLVEHMVVFSVVVVRVVLVVVGAAEAMIVFSILVVVEVYSCDGRCCRCSGSGGRNVLEIGVDVIINYSVVGLVIISSVVVDNGVVVVLEVDVLWL